jgi:ATP phosphoribosyltransferase
MSNREKIQSAENIGLPKGEKARRFADALQEEGDIEVPFVELEGGKLSVTTQGQTFWSLRGIDIVRRVEEERIDVGVVGTDVLLENRANYNNSLEKRRIGSPVCRFSLLSEEDQVEKIQREMKKEKGLFYSFMKFPTAYPNMLSMVACIRELPFMPLDMEISGSVEAYAELTGLGRVADIVDTGNNARKNGLVEVCTILDIYPELVMRPDNEAL